ncbi:MAG: DUF4166 domain-containing protein [Pirellulaceae bacterium]
MENQSLYQRVLGERYQQLHPLLREFHGRSEVRAEGTFRIIRPPQLFKRLLGSLLGMPAAAENVPTILTVATIKNAEKWVRSFGKFRMATWQWSWQHLLLERSGPVTFGIHLEIVDGGMHFVCKRVWLLGIPLPLWIAPSVLAVVTPLQHGWHAKVQLMFPLIGEMLRYEGEIYPQLKNPPRQLGALRGSVLSISPDFDAPIDDFQDYRN